MSDNPVFGFLSILGNTVGADKYSTEELDVGRADFDPKDLRTRPIQGGGTSTFVDKAALVTRLNETFGGCWSFFTEGERLISKDEVDGKDDIAVAKGFLVVNVPGRPPRIYSQMGSTAVNRIRSDAQYNASKAIDAAGDMQKAGSQAFRRCAHLALGIMTSELDGSDAGSGDSHGQSSSSSSSNKSSESPKPKNPDADASDKQKGMLSEEFGSGWLGKAVHFPVEDYDFANMKMGQMSELIDKCMKLKNAGETWDGEPHSDEKKSADKKSAAKKEAAPAEEAEAAPAPKSAESDEAPAKSDAQQAALDRIKAQKAAQAAKKAPAEEPAEEAPAPKKASGSSAKLAELYQATASVIGVWDGDGDFDYSGLDADDKECIDSTLSSIYNITSSLPIPSHDELGDEEIAAMLTQIKDMDGSD